MKKIIVCGAGHGGLTAAAKLAENGFDVTVYEKLSCDEIGHDWEDRFSFELLSEITGIDIDDFPDDSWRYRGDCAFISPAKRKHVEIFYNDDTRQKIMWRKSILNLLVKNCEKYGVNFIFNTEVLGPIVENNKVLGINTSEGNVFADLVIDSCGVFSPLRSQLPDCFMIEKSPKHGDVFYSWRAYFNKSYNESPKVPFEVYMYHEGEQGLSWFCTNDDNVDVLIGRTDKFDDTKLYEQLEIFRKDHPWLGNNIIHGGSYGAIPVRRPLTLMVASGYAACGDSAFMTMPMNGMGIDLSLQAGKILAETIIENKNKEFSADVLWKYNRKFHSEYGYFSCKNEGLKNAILSVPSVGVDFLFESEVIQASDLASAGKNTDFASLLGKLVRGLKKPSYFFALIKGLIRGSKVSDLYRNPPLNFNIDEINKWSKKIESYDIRL